MSALDALRELVACKDLKDELDAWHRRGFLCDDDRSLYRSRQAEYEARKTAAWAAARQVLSGESERDGVIEECAKMCEDAWRNASNVRPEYRQNMISHGCIACAKALRSLKSDQKKDSP